MRQMAIYFCQFNINSNERNLYIDFLNHINPSNHDVMFSTLNYDLLLEYAASRQGVVISYFFEYPQQVGDILIWNLHGSCNFIPTTIQLDNRILFESGIVFDTGLKGVDRTDAINFCNSPTGLYPAMCLYMRSKHSQIGYTQLRKIQEWWKNQVLAADKVLVIGVKPYFYDKHIWEPLRESKAKVGFVGSSDSYKEWISKDRDKDNTKLIGHRWDECFRETIKFLKP